MADSCFRFGGIRSRGSKVIGCDLGVRFPPKFQRPVAAKPYVGSEKQFYRCKTGTELLYLYHHAEYDGARTSQATGRGAKVL